MFSKCAGDPESQDDGAATSGAGKVSNWSLGLRQLLTDAAGYATFAKFLANEYSKENIEFWQECERYRTDNSAGLAQEIWTNYLREGAPQAVNVDGKVRLATEKRLQEAPPDLFDKAQEQIFRLMEFDSYRRFLCSEMHAKCAQAELLGQPQPYLPATPRKIKKSRSNVEDARNRSVLARLRGSRERTPQHNNNNNNLQSSAPRRPSLSLAQLCRVMLPDSATSMQNTRSESGEPLTIRESIDNLLKNRGIKCKDYDVIIRGDPRPVDINDSMSSLAGREVVVERRVVLRLQVVGCRPLSARTAPEKPLSAVVRSALSYHQYPVNGREITVTRGGETVHLDTKVEHLENERLQIQITPAPALKSACSKPEDASTNEQPLPNASANRLPPSTARLSPSNQNSVPANHTRATCPSLDEITNRVFEDVLHGKSQLQVPTDSSVKSDNCSSEHSSGARGALVAKLRPGDPLHVAPTAAGVNSAEHLPNHRESQQRQRLSKLDVSNCGLPRIDTIVTPPVPAARNITRPRPAVRTSLARQTSPSFNIPPDTEPAASPSRTSSESGSPRTVDPPPLPPKPKVLPTKPSNWGQSVRSGEADETPLNRMVYLSDQPTSSFV